MRVLLINVPYENVYKVVKSAIGKVPPMNLAYLAAYLREKGHEIRIIDMATLEIKVGELKKCLEQPFDVIGVSAMTPSFSNAIRVLKVAREVNPACVTVMGGSHISTVPAQTLQENGVLDYAVVGEGEVTMAELLDAIAFKKNAANVNGIAFRGGNRIISTPARARIKNLANIPFPAYDLLPMDKYETTAHHAWANRAVATKPYGVLHTSRGCCHSCNFCASRIIWGREVIFREPSDVLEEIDLLVRGYGIKFLDVNDDSFLLNKNRVHRILDGMIQRKYNLNFCCQARVDEVDEPILKKMKLAGCHLIRFGVESCSQRVLDSMNKRSSVDNIRHAFDLCRKVGLSASANIIIGYPGETKKTFNETLKVLKEVDPIGVAFFMTVPIIGTELYKTAVEKDLILTRNWDDWVQLPSCPSMRIEGIALKEQLKMRRKAYLSFYCRPSFILKRLPKNLDQLKAYFRGAKGLFSLLKK